LLCRVTGKGEKMYRGINQNQISIKQGDYVSGDFSLAALYALRQENPVVLVLSGNVQEIPEEERAYDCEFLADTMQIEKILIPNAPYSSHYEVAINDSHPLLKESGWRKL